MKKKHKITTSRWVMFLCMFLLAITACDDDILEQANPNAPTPDTFWLTAIDADRGVIGSYSPITGVQYYGRMFVFASDYRDDIVNGFAISPRTAPGRFQGTSDIAAVRVVWQEAWKSIVRANQVLFNVPNIPMEEFQVSGFAPEDKDAILGEALFVRSLVYFDLANLWLNIPLITTPLTFEEANNVSQAPQSEIFAQLIIDLEQARGMLPMTRDGNKVGRATWGAASALLAKVYLTTGQYPQAESVLREIMNSGLYSLVDDYGDNFRSTTENNSESVFELQMVTDGNTGWGGDAANTGRANSVIPDFAPRGFTNQDGMAVNDWVLDLFLEERTINDQIDPRAFYTLFWNTNDSTNYRDKTLKSETYGDQSYSEVFGTPNADNPALVWGNKYIFSDDEDGNTSARFHFGDMNFRLIRYADILLYFAEAVMQGGAVPAAQEAIDAVNLVRARADMPPLTSLTFEDLQNERVKELALEHYRYYDLLRWGIVKERIVDRPGIKSNSGGVGAYVPGREYMDIPQVDLDVNPNLQRNPGY